MGIVAVWRFVSSSPPYHAVQVVFFIPDDDVWRPIRMKTSQVLTAKRIVTGFENVIVRKGVGHVL